MHNLQTRRCFLNSMLAATAVIAGGRNMMASPNKRETMLNWLQGKTPDYFPAAFFIHFDPSCSLGEPAAKKHLEFFRQTQMDFVKIQYERIFPSLPAIQKPEDWAKMPHYKLDFYEPQLAVVKGLVAAAKKEALIVMTLYSPFMCAGHTASLPLLTQHLQGNPEQVKKGLEIITDSLMLFVKECIRLGVDGFYASTQGGEAGRFQDPRVFRDYVKPSDLVLMNEINRACQFNILHVCDYNGPYADLKPFYDYPGHVINCNPRLTSGNLSWKEVGRLFKRPCMGGMDRHGIMANGSTQAIARTVEQVLKEVPTPFILGADCTVPNDIKWENIQAAINSAHGFKKGA
jgi:uroporphyrinogen decarboxylase